MHFPKTSVAQHGTIATIPIAIYGSGPVLFHIGNGGAGPTGLIEALCLAYLAQRPQGSPAGSIAWLCNHSRNTQLALLHGHIDVALTYERVWETVSVQEGWARDWGCVFHDHFLLCGPASDPAGLCKETCLKAMLERIAEGKALWHSRADGSATQAKELELWQSTSYRDSFRCEPGEEAGEFANKGVKWSAINGGSACETEHWYHTSLRSPYDALREADKQGAYSITDRATLLRGVADQVVEHTVVFWEPETAKDKLMNSCHALTGPDPDNEVTNYIEFLTSAAGQNIVRTFGRDEVGIPFFAGVAEGCATAKLRHGRAQGGRWVFTSNDGWK